MNYNTLKNAITAVIKENGNEEITGQIMQDALVAIINALGLGFQFMGEAKPATDPGTPDARVFYVAADAGNYSHFGGVSLNGKSVAFFLWTDTWSSINLPIPTNTALSDYLSIANLATATGQGTNTAMTQKAVTDALNNKVDKVEGKGLSTNDLTDALKAKVEGALAASKVLQDLGDDATAVISQAAMTIILAGYAKIDGYYQSLIAGAAENLVGHGSVPAAFLRRTSGGTADIGTGSAILTAIKGRSIVWNQKIMQEVVLGVTSNKWGTFDSGLNLTADGNVLQMLKSSGYGIAYYTLYSGTIQSGHVYYLAADIKTTAPADYISVSAYGVDTTIDSRLQVASNQWQRITKISRCATAASTQQFRITDSRTEDFDIVYAKNFALIDLTLMFGAGNEPSTIEGFEKLYPQHNNAFSPGQVLPFAGEKLVTTGFNQWDGETEEGYYDPATGLPGDSISFVRSKEAINVFPSTGYYFHCEAAISSGSGYIVFYDIDDHIVGTSVIINTTNISFTTPAGCAKVKFYTKPDFVQAGININLSWSGIRNGEYEPYEVHELEINPAALLDVNGDPVFPNSGMHGVGTAFDSMKPETDGFIRFANRVFARVNLGSLEWTIDQSAGIKRFMAAIPCSSVWNNCICSKYSLPSSNQGANQEDKTIKINETYGAVARDDAYTTPAEFKAANAGVYLFYELTTPEVVELATPIATQYYVNDFGTEEWQPANGTEPYTAPCNLEIQYAMNAVDTLRRLPENYISIGSFENFCTELATKLGAALNKTITITPAYNATTQEYDFTISIVDAE